MEAARDKRAQKIEGDHQRGLGGAGLHEPGGVQQSEVGRDAGVGKDGEVRAPAECVPDLLNGCGRGAVGGVGGIAGAAKCVEAADAKVTAGETDWFAGGAPAIAREGGEEGLHGHLKLDGITHIALLSKPFMGKESYAFAFIAASGRCAFKIYLGRDADRRLLADQVTRFQHWRQLDSLPATTV